MSRGAGYLVAWAALAVAACARGDLERTYGNAPATASTPTPRTEYPSPCPEVGEDGELIHAADEVLLASVDDTHIYYSVYAPPAIHRVGKDGSGPVEEVGPYDRAFESALIKFDGGSVFWMMADPVTGIRSILQYDKQTLELVRRYELPPRVFWDYAMDGEYFYAVGIGCESPVRVSRETGSVDEVEFAAITAGGTTSLLLDEEHLYCSNYDTVVRVPRSMASLPQGVATVVASIGGLADGGSDLVWADTSDQLKALSKETLTVSTVAVSGARINNDALHRDDASGCFYFLTSLNACNTLARHCPGDEEVTILTSGADHDRVRGGFDIDEEYYYWTTRQGIRRKPKPPL